ncbi:neuron navigator 2-like isoform X3 [Pomacea canaliculata]|uniref:neuron navigator 2-like isoform X3 n=1 Tax=Pomacea canaliculata TaxID=400727 RepID=UPI000D731990|nr:neuron navigator 2-like isoform X3 [Pomacea canaliculata]
MANKQSSPSPKHGKRSGGQADQGSYSVPETIKIYTDWANHYLEKARNKKFITDLQHDIADGVLLAEVIEAVTNEKIRDIKPKPKNSAQMVENINTCLTFLAGLGVSVEGLSAKDIKDGNLKAILGLFFSLSRYKQQQKTQQSQKQGDREPSSKDPQQPPPQQQQVSILRSQCSTGSSSVAIDSDQAGSGGKAAQQLNGGEMISRLPSPFRQGHASKGGPAAAAAASSTPCKETALSTAQLNARNSRAAAAAATAAAPAPVASTGDKSRSHGNQQNNNVAAWNTGSSLAPPRSSAQGSSGVQPRATSPGAAPTSGIPTPVGRGRPGSGGDKQSNRTSASSTSSTSSSKSSSSKPSTSSSSSGNKNSMLDKFKFFNKDKDKKGGTKSASKASSSSRSEAESRGGSCDVKSSASAPNSSPSESSASLASTVDGACAPASSTAPAGKGSSSSSAKSGKKSLVRAFSTKREHSSSSGGGVSGPGALSPEEHLRQASPAPSPVPPGLVLASPSSSASVLSGSSPALGRKTSSASGSKAERGDPRLGQPSPTPSKKGSKLGSFIPTSKPSSSASSSGKGSKSSSGPPLDIVGLQSSSSAPTTPSVPPPPLPSTIPTGIPKPQGRSGGRGSKEEKRSGGSSSREHKSLFGGQPGSGSQRGLSSSSSKTSLQQPQQQQQQQVQVPLTQQQLQRHHQQLQQLQLQQLKQQQQQQHHHHQSRGQHYEHSGYPEQQQQPTSPSFSTFSSVPGNFHIPGYANIFQQQHQQQLQQHSTPTSPTSSQPLRLPPSNSSHSVQSGHARVNVQSLDRGEVLGPGSNGHARSLERHAKESAMSLHDVSDRSAFSPTSSTAAHYVPVTIPAAGLEGHGRTGLGGVVVREGAQRESPTHPFDVPQP